MRYLLLEASYHTPCCRPNIARRATWTLNFIDNSTLQIPFDWWFQRSRLVRKRSQYTNTWWHVTLALMCQRRTWTMDIVCSTLRGEVHLLTLEALWIRDMKPSIKDEYKSRERVIKFWWNNCLELIGCTINVFFFLFISEILMMMILCIEKYSTSKE